jgi:hypothetical protein
MKSCCNKRLKNFRWDASNDATVISNLLLEELVFADAPDSEMNQMFKVYSPFDVLLISKKPKRREKSYKFSLALLKWFRPYVGIHNENIGRVSIGNRKNKVEEMSAICE